MRSSIMSGMSNLQRVLRRELNLELKKGASLRVREEGSRRRNEMAATLKTVKYQMITNWMAIKIKIEQISLLRIRIFIFIYHMTYQLKKGNFWVLKERLQTQSLPKAKYLLKRGVIPFRNQQRTYYFQGAKPISLQNQYDFPQQLSLKRIRNLKKSTVGHKQNAFYRLLQIQKTTSLQKSQKTSKDHIIKAKSQSSFSNQCNQTYQWHLSLRNSAINFSALQNPPQKPKKRIKIKLSNIDQVFNRSRWWSRGLES